MADLEDASSETSDVELLSEGANDDVVEETPETKETDTEETGETEETPTEETSEEEESKELEDEEEESSEEEITRPSWKDIKDKYPELAKNEDFREMFHREKAYSEVFPTVADAKDAEEKSRIFDFFDNSLLEGDPKVFLNALDEKVVTRFAENILPSLYSVNPNLFARATQPIIIDILHSIDERAGANGDKNLKLSVQNISKALFGKFDLPPKIQRTRDPEVEQEKQNLRAEQNRILSAEKDTFLATSDKSIKRQLTNVLSEGIDPKGILSEFTRNAIIRATLDETREVLQSDKAFISKMHNLFRLAERARFSPDYKPRIISAYLGRAKTIALGLRAKHKAAAIGRRVPSSKNPVNKIQSKPGEGKISQNSNPKGKPSKSKSDLDIIMEGA